MRFFIILFVFPNALVFTGCRKDNHVVVKHFDAKLVYDGEVLQVDTEMQLLNEGEDAGEVVLYFYSEEAVEITNVSVKGKKVGTRQWRGNKVCFDLPEKLRQGEATDISIAYKTRYDFEREGAYYHFPVTYFSSYRTFTMEVACPDRYFVATAGNLTELTDRNGEKRCSYTNDIPGMHPGIFIGTGYEHHTLESGNRQFDLYITPEQKVPRPKLLEMMREVYYFWEDKMGPLPYYRISLVVNNTENTPSSAAHSIISVNKLHLCFDKSIYSILAHETGHLWWGNMISEGLDSAGSQYIVEPVVEYFALIFLEDKYEMKNEMKIKFRLHYSKFLSRNRATEELFRDSSLGGLSRSIFGFSMLNHIMGRENMYKFVRNLYEKHAFSMVSNRDFQRSAEETCGKDLSWFFDGFYRSKSRYDIALADVRTSGDGPPYHTEFRIYERYGKIRNPSDVEVAIRTENEIRIRKISGIDGKGKRMSIDTDSKVLSVTVDPDYKLTDWNRANNSTAWDISDYRWHPHGKGIFVHRADGKITYCDGSDNKVIAGNALSDRYKGGNFVPSPDGGKIAYIVSEGRNELWISDIQSGKATRAVRRKTGIYGPKWGGERLFFEVARKAEGSRGARDIWSWTAEKGAAPLFEAGGSGGYRSPVPSPGGKKLAFISAGDNYDELWISGISGDNRRRLVRKPYIGAPVWDSEGKQLAFAGSAQADEKTDIHTIDADIGAQSLKQLTKSENPGANNWNPVWSPDDSVFFVSDRNRNADICKVSPDGRETQMTDDPADEYLPYYNQITNQTAYLCNETEPPELRVMDSDGNNKRPLPLCGSQKLMTVE